MNLEDKMREISTQNNRVGMLQDMLGEKVKAYCVGKGGAGFNYGKNTNASKAAILDQIKTLRNELLVLAEIVKES